MSQLVDTDVTRLSDHLAILRRQWRLMAVLLVLGALVGFGLSYRAETLYAAETRLLLEPTTTEQTSGQRMDPTEVSTLAQLVGSVEIADRVIDELELDTEPSELLNAVDVSAVEQTRVVVISALWPDAEEVAAITDSFATQYIDYQVDANAAVVSQTVANLIEERSFIETELDDAEQELAGASDDERADLEAQVESLRIRAAELTTEIALSEVGEDTAAAGGVVLEDAKVPKQAAEPKPVRAALLGGVIGLILGAVLGYARDRLDDRIRDEGRLKSLLGDVPVLGRIPFDTRKQPARPVALVEPRSPVSEAFRALNTNLRFLAAARTSDQPSEEGEILVVTSALTAEGKTTVAGNLAVTAARTGLRVLLVDADLRKPSISDLFGVETPRGLAHLLAGQKLKVRVDTAEPNLRIVGAGMIPPNPAELLASPRAAAIWQQLRQQADLVVVDTPPVLSVADALEITHHADWVLLTVRNRQSREHHVLDALERLHRVGSPVTGVVWASITGDGHTYYGYGEPLVEDEA
ncbi:polysaccharide biosynthesis tyrosine autokinase [Nocardioides sp.]|uniref:polysaccharide biosynthesis tyrosine autokinase n=1 Tax=Nocardioides sp. TaxID=35761 RepID=UPI002ED5743B